MAAILLVLFYLFFPLVILYLSNRFRFLNQIGPVVVAYTIGMTIGNTGLLTWITARAEVQELLTITTIPIAIPLLLFSMDLKKWSGMAGKTMLSMLFALIAVLTSVLAGFFIFRTQGINNFWDISGMLTALYTGSTPNLAAVKIALNADETHYLLVAAYDLLVGAFHLLFVMTVAQRLFLTYLPEYKKAASSNLNSGTFDGDEPYYGLLQLRLIAPLSKAFGISVVIFGIAGGISLILPETIQMATVILIITSLGIMVSMIPPVRKIEKSFDLGMYLILVFSLVIASMADLSKINFSSLVICAYVIFVVFGSMLIQSLLSRYYKIDADTFLITSTAFICNPAIVPVVAGALKNREIIFSGLMVSIIGLAIGNYMGVFIAYILSSL